MVVYLGAGGIANGTGALSVAIPSGYVAGDFLVLAISGRDSLPALPDGWTNIGTVNNGTDIYNRTCYKFASASESAVTVADSGVYTLAQVFLFTGVDATNPINASTTNTDDGTTFSATGVTTTVDNCMIVHSITFQDAGAASDGTNYTGQANANLASVTEQYDYYYYGGSAGVDGGLCFVTGYKAVAGATGNTTATADSASNKSAVVTFAITPSATPRVVFIRSGSEAYGTGAINVGVASGYAAGDLLVLYLSGKSSTPDLPAGWTDLATANNSTNIYGRVCYKIATASEGTTVTIADSGVYTYGVMQLFKNNSSTPINVSTTNTDSGTTFSADGVTTTVDKCAVVVFSAFFDDGAAYDSSNYSSQSNANLALLTEQKDAFRYVSAGIGAGLYILTGYKETAGATGSTTATSDSANNYSAIVTFAIQPPVAAGVPEGGSESTVIVSVQGSGLSIRQGGASASTIVSAQGGGIAIRQGSGSSTVIVDVQGSGAKTASGGDESPVTVDAEADGAKTGQGGASVTVTVSPDGSGVKIASSGAESPVVASVEGDGIKIGSGSSESTVVISTEGAGTVIDIISGGSESSVVITAEASGNKQAQGGAESPVTIEVQGSGIRVMSGGAESSVTVSVEADGYKQGQGGSEPSVIVSVEGDGYGIGLIKSGGSETLIVVSSDGSGSKLASGGSEPIIIVTVEGFGTDYNPIILTAVFAQPKLTAVFEGIETSAVFEQPELTAAFEEPELSAVFAPIIIGGVYGKG